MGTDEENSSQEAIDDRSDRRLRFAVKLFAAIILFCIVTSIELSTIDLNFASFLYGSDQVWAGHRASFRLGAIDAQSKRPLKKLSVDARLKAGNETLETVEAVGHQWAEFKVKIPKDPPKSPLSLDITVKSEQGTDTFQIPLQVTSSPATVSSEFQSLDRLYDDDNAQAPREVKGYQLKLYPLAGHLVSGLTNPIVGQLFHQGKPTEGQVQSTELGLLETTSPQGLVRFEWRPMISPRPLSFKVGSHPIHSQMVRIKPQPSQLLLHRPEPWLNSPGSSAAASIRSLPFRGRFHIDVWAGNCLLLAASEFPEGDGFEFALKLPPDFEGLLRVDAYKNFMAPAGTVTSSHLWVSSKPMSEATQDLLKVLKTLPNANEWKWVFEGSGPLKQAMIPLLLSRLFPKAQGAPLILSTLETRKTTVTDERDGLRRHIHRLFFITIITGAFLLIAWVFNQRRRVKRDVTQVIQEGIIEGEDLDPEAIRELTKPGNSLEILVTLGAISLSLYSIYILLTQLLHWGW